MDISATIMATIMMAEKSDESPATPGSASVVAEPTSPGSPRVVYGDRMQPEQLAWLRNVHFFFLGITSLGTVLQILQVFIEPVGWASTAVYYLYNLAAIVIARMLLITLKFEHKEASSCLSLSHSRALSLTMPLALPLPLLVAL